MKTKKICLFVFLASIILVSKMGFAQNRSSLQQHITRKWTKEVINKAHNPSPIESPSIDFKPGFKPFKIPRYFDYPRYFDCPRPCQDYYSYKRFPNIILPCKRGNKDILVISNISGFSYKESWEDILLSYLETSKFYQSREVLVQLKYDVIVRSGPGYNYDIIKNLKRDCYIRIASDELREGITDWKKYKIGFI